LSDGQKYRYKLAKLIDRGEKNVWILDEFCASLDRVMARIIAFLIQKVARRLGKTVVVATTHEDLVEDFQPDVLVYKGFEKDVEVTRKESEHKPCSVCEKIRVEEGSMEDYGKLCRFHYRSAGERKSGLRSKAVFRLMYGDSLVGVIVYSCSYLNLKPRNMVFGERYVYTSGDLHKARLINEEIARISRVVIHPKFRGIGLGEHLVRETLPKAGARVVEALAVMARYNPFFEKAGMVKVEYRRKENELTSKIRKLLETREFDFSLAGSKTYCHQVFNTLGEGEKQELMAYLTEFANQPFIKMQTAEPSLLARVFSHSSVYLYWISCP